MLREPHASSSSAERKIINNIKPSPFVLSLVEGLPKSFFSNLLENLFPLRAHASLHLRIALDDRREFVLPFEGAYGFEHQTAVEAGFLARNDWVERAAPATPQEIDRRLGIAARAQRPNDLLEIKRIDVVVNDDAVAPQVSAGSDVGCEQCGLLRVTGIHLLDRDDGQHDTGADFVTAHSWIAGHDSNFESVPHQGRSQASGAIGGIRRRDRRRSAADDGIVTVKNGFTFRRYSSCAPLA